MSSLPAFPRTLAAVKKGEHTCWEIGDALVDECGPPSTHGVRDNSYEKLRAAQKYLLENGYEYGLNHLADLRDVAFNFQTCARKSDLSFHVHRKARTPEMLEAIIAGAPDGTKITGDYVEKIVSAQRLERQAAQRAADEKAREEARKEREKAEANEEEARLRAANAKNPTERAEAEHEADEAAKTANKARRKENSAKAPPAPKPGVPKEEEVPALVAKLLVSTNASKALLLAKEAEKAILPHIESLSPAASAGMTDAIPEVANRWRRLAELVQKEHGEYEHLSVVGE
jgi:hypothetical protein